MIYGRIVEHSMTVNREDFLTTSFYFLRNSIKALRPIKEVKGHSLSHLMIGDLKESHFQEQGISKIEEQIKIFQRH